LQGVVVLAGGEKKIGSFDRSPDFKDLNLPNYHDYHNYRSLE
jgi:hypothetical protein